DKHPGQLWYSTGTDDWFHTDPVGVEALTKWRAARDAIAVGAGVTLGTMTDNGYTFAAKLLLVFSFPGPVILLQGKANLLTQRARLDAAEPLFRTLTVLDFRAGNVMMGLDLHYLYKADGSLLDLRGSAEAYYDFHDSNAWHIYLGEREPRDHRVRAELLKRLIHADAYFMIDSRSFQTG